MSWQAGMPYYYAALAIGLMLLTVRAKSSR
jgi:hypothetical protein